MKILIPILAAVLAATVPAGAQTFNPQRATSEQNPEPRKLMCWNGTTYADCAVGSLPPGAPTLAHNQVVIGTSSTLLVPARAGRKLLTITTTAANACSFGNSGVTLTTGFPLQPVAGATITIAFAGALYGSCSTATTTGYLETF